MDIEPQQFEHEDLEEKFQISASVEFTSNQNGFQGLMPLEIKIKKKKEKKTTIQNVELRKTTGGLF